jgi:hypothetical protein
MDESRKKIYLATGVNESYLPKADPYIQTLNRVSNVHNVVVTLDFDVSPEYRQRHSSVHFVRLSPSQVQSPSSNSCLQHGGFLPALDFVGPDDLVVFTDADIQMQRPFREEELAILRSFEADEIGVGYNKSENDYLAEEAERLKPRVPIDEIRSKYPGIDTLKTYNTGVVVARRRTYEKLYRKYDERWADVNNLFDQYAKQQWLLSYLIQTQFKPRILPDAIHTHGHYPVALRVPGDAGYRFCIGADPVVLNHNIQHPAEERVHELTKQNNRLRRRVRRLLAALAVVGVVCVFLIVRSLL